MSLVKQAETLCRNMSIKEKVQQIIQQTELDKAAELRLREKERLQLNHRREALIAAKFEKGKKTLEATGVQRVFDEVFDILKTKQLDVELHFREVPADNFGLFVEGNRVSGGKTQLGVALSTDNPKNIWVISAKGLYREEDIVSLKDPLLLVKIENCLAQHIANGDYYWDPHESNIDNDYGIAG